jgi:hypothetical protein
VEAETPEAVKGEELPFTGFPLWAAAAVAGLFFAAGLGLRAVGHRRRS